MLKVLLSELVKLWRGICTVGAFIIPSTCIRERDIVVTLLVRVLCLSVCLHLIAS